MGWTEERVEKLRQLWNEGMSASKIAKELGGVTRNAVIGKVHRLGLSNRTASAPGGVEGAEAAPAAADPLARQTPEEVAAAPVAPPTVEERPEPAAAEEAAPAPVALRRDVRDASQPRPPGQPTPEEESARETLAEIEKMARKLTLLELTERTCKWPIGDPNDDDFHFCGLPSIVGKPYCEHHVGIAFQPMSARRDRSRSR